MTHRVLYLSSLLSLIFAAIPAQARLGMTQAEWEAAYGRAYGKAYGRANGSKVYQWEGPGGRARGGPFLMMIRLENDRVTGIQVQRKSGDRFATTPAREMIAALRLSSDHHVPVGDALSDDGKTITLVMPKEENTDPPVVGMKLAPKGEALMGKYASDWIKAFGKANDKGYYTSGPYQIQTATNKNSGKVDWIKVVKASGETITDEEAGRIYESLTGRKREQVSNPPELHKEGTMLLMMKPKKRK